MLPNAVAASSFDWVTKCLSFFLLVDLVIEILPNLCCNLACTPLKDVLKAVAHTIYLHNIPLSYRCYNFPYVSPSFVYTKRLFHSRTYTFQPFFNAPIDIQLAQYPHLDLSITLYCHNAILSS